MPDITPIKVWIGLRANGHADHPDWNLVDLSNITDNPIKGNGRHADDFVIESWFYDICCGHDANTPDSPHGGRWGVRLVTPQFARESIKTFPGKIFPMTEAEMEAFYEDHCVGKLPELETDTEALAAIKTELELRTLLGEVGPAVDALKAKARRALDPDEREPGMRRSPRRHWAGGLKDVLSITVVPVAVDPP